MFTKNSIWLYALGLVIILFAGPQMYAGGGEDSTKWYAGAFGGYVSGKLNSNGPAHEQSTGDYKDDSPIAGVFIGYRHLFENHWFGAVEAIIPVYFEKGTAVDKEYYPDLVKYEAVFKYAFLVAVKYGKCFDNIQPYVYGAVGFVNVDGRTLNVDENDNYSPGFIQSAAATHFVWQLGGGADYNVNEVIFVGARVGAFIGAQADHTMSWNEPGPNLFGYDSVIMQINIGYRF